MSGGLGRLRKTLKDRCPECDHTLELRVVEEIVFILGDETTFKEEEYLNCPRCGFEIPYQNKKKKKFVPKEDF